MSVSAAHVDVKCIFSRVFAFECCDDVLRVNVSVKKITAINSLVYFGVLSNIAPHSTGIRSR